MGLGFRSPVSAHPIRDLCNMAMVDFSVGDMEVIFRGDEDMEGKSTQRFGQD